MARKCKAPPRWRAPFLRALKATGNAREAARAAGVDHSLAYYHRRRDAAFAAEWEAALASAGDASADSGPRSAGDAVGAELVLRRSKRRGDQLVRAGPGRWSEKAEGIFLGVLARSANVRRAAAAAGFSTNALYYRRETYPGFAGRWDRALEQSKVHLRGLVISSGIATFDPESADEAGALPKVTVAEAISILRLKDGGPAGAGAERGLRYGPPEPSIEEVRASVIRRLDAIEAHERRKAGGQEEL